MKKLIFVFVFTFAFLNMIKADAAAVDDPIILTEKFINPIGGHGATTMAFTLPQTTSGKVVIL